MLRARWDKSGDRVGMVGQLALFCVWNLSTIVACDRAPREPSGGAQTTVPDSQPTIDDEVTAGSGGGEEPEPASDACVVPLAEPPPPDVGPVAECPEDPDGRPEMPFGTVSFPGAPEAPTLRVELALTSAHQSHGLMYRPTLSDEEGMLFSWNAEQARSFWMKNTCLALDMLFIQADGTISKILENVPPMNTLPRRSDPCAVAHVLEVRAGFTRIYGVKPGQKMLVSAPGN